MEIKYKLGDIAKQLNLPNKKLADLLVPLGVEGAKHTTQLSEAQLNYLFDRLTAENSEVSLDAFLDSAPKPQPKPGEVLKRADGSVVEIPQNQKKNKKKPAPPQPAAAGSAPADTAPQPAPF